MRFEILNFKNQSLFKTILKYLIFTASHYSTRKCSISRKKIPEKLTIEKVRRSPKKVVRDLGGHQNKQKTIKNPMPSWGERTLTLTLTLTLVMTLSGADYPPPDGRSMNYQHFAPTWSTSLCRHHRVWVDGFNDFESTPDPLDDLATCRHEAASTDRDKITTTATTPTRT
jgi:hypothetical protein